MGRVKPDDKKSVLGQGPLTGASRASQATAVFGTDPLATREQRALRVLAGLAQVVADQALGGRNGGRAAGLRQEADRLLSEAEEDPKGDVA